MQSYAKLRTDLVAVPAEVDGQQVVNIKDPLRNNYFRLREPEYWLISQLDGYTSYEEVAERFRNKYELNISEENVIQFVDLLEQQYFLENSRSEQQVSRKSYGSKEKRSLFSRMLFIKIKAIDPGRILEKLSKLYRPFHSLTGQILQLIIVLYGIVLFIPNADKFAINLFELFNITSITLIVISIFILVTIHEFAHAVVCRIHGGEVREMGFLFMYFQPCCYCDLSDAWLFKEKRKRLAVTWAGPYSGLILFTIMLIMWRVTVPGTIVNEIAHITVIVIWITMLFNLNPLIKLDGYYLLSDWLEIPNLRIKSFRYFKYIFQRYLLGWSIDKVETTSREKRVYLIYAILALIYTVFIIIYFLYLLAGFLVEKIGPIGLILLFAVLVFSLRHNFASLLKGILKHFIYLKDIMKRPLRLTFYIVLIIVLSVVMFFIPFPHRVSGEVSVNPIAEFSLLLNDFGLLEKKFRRGGAESEMKSSYIQMASQELASLDLIPHVNDGQKIAIGDTLAILVSNQVTREIESEQSTLKKLQNDLALLQSPPKKEEIDEAISEVNAAQTMYDQKLRDQIRVKELSSRGLVAENELESALAETQIAKAELANKRAKLKLLKSPPKPEEEAVIRSQIEKQEAKLQFLKNQQDAQSIISTISGIVVINQKEEEFLSIIDNQKVEVLVPVSDFDIELIKVGQDVKLKVRSYTNKVFTGKVVHIPQDAVELNEKAYFMISAVLENIDVNLHKGMTGYAKIEIGTTSLFNLIMRRLTSIIRVEFWSWW
jgi:putative peptide zinc metalloprotease protein